ncbi:competence/damage-inducible protein A [Chakrabartyella piscis]|uniref:competence/damage-inducible protein A n=1 Tax=Chakrabartyella piscis TaxID=2918914 RepID=UPI002958B597|nr:competence/damage-inducible protein A [Chakrabartyella piscis]
MKAEILAVGTELLLGDILNTNAQYLAKELASLGIDVYYQSVIGDNPKRLEDTLFHAFSRVDLVITTGGLGPTEDDLTKETAAKYFDEELLLDQRALSEIEAVFAKTGRVMTENNLKQAYVPKENGFPLYNANGTAPGVVMEKNGKIIVMLPGPPKEVIPMFENQVEPYLASKSEYLFHSRILRVASVGESAMESKVKDIIDAQTNPTIAPYAKDGEAILRITAKAKSLEEANALIDPVAEALYARLGKAIYAEGETTMETEVAKLLIAKQKTIAVAESCTGGLIAANLIRYPGISEVFLEGCVTYSNEAKENRLDVNCKTLEIHGAVSPETAKEMAEGIAKTSGANIGVSTTGVAGPDGGTPEKPVGLVYIGICIDGITIVKEFHGFGDRNKIRERATYYALNCLRKQLQADNM